MTTTLRTRTVLLTAAVLVPAALTTTSLAGTATASSASAPVTLEATLGPSGDANGRGSATIKLDKARKRVCATLDWRRIQTPDAAHIHNRSDGAIKIDLVKAANAADGKACTRNVPKRDIADVLEHPRRYYVNVHNPTYPSGAIQGNLHR
jgi:hypothetical protein